MVDYSKFDGIADSDEETTEPIELGTTREAGNALFKQKKYAAAIATYSALSVSYTHLTLPTILLV